MKPLEAIATLAAAFQKELSPETVTIYSEALSDLDAGLLSAAVRQCITTCTFFPAVAEIRKAAARLSGKLPPSAAQLLAIIRRADTRNFDWNPGGSICRHSWKWPADVEESTLEVCMLIARKIGVPCDRDGNDIFGWETDVRKAYEAEIPTLEANALLSLSGAKLIGDTGSLRLS